MPLYVAYLYPSLAPIISAATQFFWKYTSISSRVSSSLVNGSVLTVFTVVVVVVAFVVLTDVLVVGCVSDFVVVALVATVVLVDVTAVFVDVIEVAGPLLQPCYRAANHDNCSYNIGSTTGISSVAVIGGSDAVRANRQAAVS